MTAIINNEYYMRQALKEAEQAFHENEIPVGAIVVSKGQIIARGHNLTERLTDVTAHAEIQAVTAAANMLGGKYLTDCTLYVTLEPCVMCAGALFWSQLSAIVYGADDEKRGFSLYTPNILHPKTQIFKGVLQEECSQLLKDFFRNNRRL